MTLKEWTIKIAPPLHRIEDYSRAVRRAVDELPSIPSFMTKAESELSETIRAVEAALNNLKSARDAFHAKNVEAA